MKHKPYRVAVALVHWPVLDKSKRVVCTNVTNLDVHDIARASRVYGVDRYYIINPMKEQVMFVHRILDFWRVGYGGEYNSSRREALKPVHTAHSLEEAIQDWGGKPQVITTSARAVASERPHISFKDLRQKIEQEGGDYLLVFGTGYGLEDSIFKQCHLVLEPIRGPSADDFRHLSVRSAVSICLDRLLGA